MEDPTGRPGQPWQRPRQHGPHAGLVVASDLERVETPFLGELGDEVGQPGVGAP
jgi:hypothetical protein